MFHNCILSSKNLAMKNGLAARAVCWNPRPNNSKIQEWDCCGYGVLAFVALVGACACETAIVKWQGGLAQLYVANLKTARMREPTQLQNFDGRSRAEATPDTPTENRTERWLNQSSRYALTSCSIRHQHREPSWTAIRHACV